MFTKPDTRSRAIALGAVFAVTVTAALTAASFSVSKEQTSDPRCATANWPYLPASCLAGTVHGDVRTVPLDRIQLQSISMTERFNSAFE